jgi:hypothetical protein
MEAAMAVLMTQELPVPIDVVNAVSKEMGVAEDPPDGLIVHVSVPRGDTTFIVDVWETREQFESFSENRLGPAATKIMKERGIEMADGPEPTIEDARDLIRGR